MRVIFSRWRFLPLLLVFACQVTATQMKPLSIDDLAKRADRIVHGTVLSNTVRRDSAGRIYTTVELEVREHWRGNHAPGRFTLVHAGGVLGDQGLSISGQEQFAIGEEVIVFAALNQRGDAVAVGMAQGKFNVIRDQQSGRVHVSNPFHPAKGESLTVEKLRSRVKGGAQ